MIDYAAAGDLLDAYGAAWETFGGDAWVALFTEDAEYHEDPFGAPLVGHNALRAYMLHAGRGPARRRFHGRTPLGLGLDGPGRVARIVDATGGRPERIRRVRLPDRGGRRGRPDQPLPRVVDGRAAGGG